MALVDLYLVSPPRILIQSYLIQQVRVTPLNDGPRLSVDRSFYSVLEDGLPFALDAVTIQDIDDPNLLTLVIYPDDAMMFRQKIIVCGNDRAVVGENGTITSSSYATSRTWSMNSTCWNDDAANTTCDSPPPRFQDSRFDVVVLPTVSIQVFDPM